MQFQGNAAESLMFFVDGLLVVILKIFVEMIQFDKHIFFEILVLIDVFQTLMAISKQWKITLFDFETDALPPGFFQVCLSQMQRLSKRKEDQYNIIY